MLNSQNHHQPDNIHFNNHQNQLQYHHQQQQQQHQQDIVNNFEKDYSTVDTSSLSNLQRHFTLSTISTTTPTTTTSSSATFCSNSNVNYRNYKQVTEPNNHVDSTSSSAFFSFNDLTTALQQDHLSSSSSTSALIELSNSSSPTSSAIFGTGTAASIIGNNSSSPSTSSVISLNRISSSASPPTSSHSSSNGTLNLGNNNSITGSPNRFNENYNNHHQNHHHNSLHHRHNMTSQYNNMNHQQQAHNNIISSTLGNNPFSLNSATGTGGGISSAGHSNNSQHNHQMQFHQHQHQQQQQQQQHKQHFTQHQTHSLSSQQQHFLQRSMSSTSSSMASPTSATSQQHHINHQFQMQSSSSPTTNKSCWCIGGDATYHFKTLVPAVAAGAIIGKGGETIAALQRDTGARVKMSKSHDFYPGTQERVCLITGSVDAIMTVLDFIMDKIREKPDLTTKLTDIESKQAQERDKQVKILVPNSTAGMIIGKAGAYIKQIKEESGSYVQISQKPKDITLQERCITIIGEKDNNKVACKMILAKIVEDPQSGTCLNVSYADVNGPVANYNPTGSPYATNQNAISSSTASLNSALGTTVTGAGLLLNGTGINLSVNLGAPNPSPNPIATQVLDHIKVAMRGSGYSETVTTEVCAALGVLAKYGVLGVGVGLPHTNGAHSAPVSYLGVSALDQSAAAATVPATSSVFGALGQVNLEQYITGQSTATPRPTTIDAAAQFDPFRHTSQAATPISINNNSFGLAAAAATTGGATAQALGAQTLGALSKSPTPGDLGAKDSKNVEIPEHIVGAILGPSGRSLVEIQHVSGANIQISKKGIFAPGTRNRIVTITGQPNAITMAHYLIEQKITEEEAKRARQNTVATAVIQ